MSRTVRTTPRKLHLHEGPRQTISLYDLRYTHAEQARAAREGRRPMPARIRRQVTVWGWLTLYLRSGCFAGSVAEAEGSARLETRLAATQIRGMHRAGHDLDDTDFPPVRHRHGALWDAF